MSLRLALLCAFFIALAVASENGNYYQCTASNLAADPEYCVLEKTSSAPSSWPTAAGPLTVDATVGANYYRKLTNSAGTELTPSPLPWTQGDQEVASTSALSGANWNYVLIYEMFAPLRNKMMFTPWDLTTAEWAKYTKAAVDCHVKDSNEVGEQDQTVYSTAETYAIMMDPKGNSYYTGVGGNGDIKNNVLQWVEEAALDLVCLVTDVDQTRCTTIRDLWGLSAGQYSDCWVDGYAEVIGSAPVTGQTLITGTYNSTSSDAPTPSNSDAPTPSNSATGTKVNLTIILFATMILVVFGMH